jgi:hypothetical protein
MKEILDRLFKTGLAPGMDEIGHIGDLDLEIIVSVFVASISILKTIISVFLKMIPFEVRNVEIESIQFNTI